MTSMQSWMLIAAAVLLANYAWFLLQRRKANKAQARRKALTQAARDHMPVERRHHERSWLDDVALDLPPEFFKLPR